MEQSENIKDLAAAMLHFNTIVPAIKKTSLNPFFKKKYAPLPEILTIISPALIKSGLVLSQLPDGDGLTTILIHAGSGQWMKAHSIMHPVRQDPQGIGSAISFQRRYSIGGVLNLIIEDDEDDDGNNASQPTKTNEPANWLNKWTSKAMTETTPAYNNCVMALKTGKTMADILKVYKVSKDIQSQLLTDKDL